MLIAVYLIPDLAQQDFDALVKLVEERTVASDGVVLVNKDAEGEVHVTETGDHAGRKGAKVGGGVGLVVGLFAPPLLAATAIGAAAGGVVGKFASKRVASGIGEKMDEALPPGSAGVIAIYDHATPMSSPRRSRTRSGARSRRSTRPAPRSSRPASRRRRQGSAG